MKAQSCMDAANVTFSDRLKLQGTVNQSKTSLFIEHYSCTKQMCFMELKQNISNIVSIKRGKLHEIEIYSDVISGLRHAKCLFCHLKLA